MSTVTLTPGELRSPEQKEYDAKVLEQVKRGLKLLEEKHGPGWEDKIDMATLDLADAYSCVLGQLYTNNGKAGYWLGSQSLGIVNRESHYGFNIKDNQGFAALTACWRDVLTPRVS